MKHGSENPKSKKLWNSTSGKLLMILLSLILVVFVFNSSKIPSYIDMYKEVQSAKVSMVNDDLEGTLLSYEKAYELVNKESIGKDIELTKNLIQSKSSYLKAEKFESENHYESAYLYFGKVIPQDTKRYELAIQKRTIMAENIVENIYKQADELYGNHLYTMVIGRLQLALDYHVKMEETEQKISEFKSVFYNHYTDKAKQNYVKFFDNDMFYNLFVQDFKNAELYTQTDAEKKELKSMQEEYLIKAVEKYFELVERELSESNKERAVHYLEIILELDETNTQAQQLLSEISVSE